MDHWWSAQWNQNTDPSPETAIGDVLLSDALIKIRPCGVQQYRSAVLYVSVTIRGRPNVVLFFVYGAE